MTPRDQLRKMTALGEQDDKHWYRLMNSISVGELRQRQEMMMRNPMALNSQVLSQTQQRLQLEPRFIDRELVPPHDMVSSSESRPLAPPLPPHSAVLAGRAFSSAGGYSFLPPDSMETVARRQEILHKQNIARMEMNAILQQKELENQQKTLLSNMENPLVYQHLTHPGPAVFRGRHRLHDNHDVFDLHANGFLMSGPYPPIGALQRERGRRPGRRATNQKFSDSGVAFQPERNQAEEKNVDESPGGASGEEKEQEAEGRVETSSEANANAKHQPAKVELTGRKGYRNGEQNKVCVSAQTGCTHTDTANISVANGDKDMDKFLFPPTTPLSAFSYVFPLGGNTLLPPAHANVFLNPDEISAVEDLRKWTVDDVYNFISNIPSCSEHAQMFKDHMIDGETLPLLTEDHLLDTLGLKLGPALKIRSQVLRRMGGALCMAAPPLAALPLQPPLEKHVERSCDVISPLTCTTELTQSPRVGECESLRPPAGHTPTSRSDMV
ncbi:sterile alpha motif domain-containing protein 7 [Hemibagrus wyckioides]|uniref:sterile alpha motif domain-containing protein 7 n=1 Tax=Hemibagrus wyckioides TaxID=337641 RepID=UPI00266DB30D|nr:sterile alpha motif domain-containing protein 7 [Hemibagrus wyckioides]XP_058250637.1 sterile alpha motif domain-containing protein 7 [Hemibagrus wyckioides]XP_058250639.1 sterile alpha motif domain-containing protein 7 [Hemibagrus wyckioides]XP_058250640.1 sterile alpha motif domain-containing protein 7 [Hemibagrus wyckioides]